MKTLLRVAPYFKKYRLLLLAGYVAVIGNAFFNLAVPALIGSAVDDGVVDQNVTKLIEFSVLIVVASALRGLCAFGQNYLGEIRGARWQLPAAARAVPARPAAVVQLPRPGADGRPAHPLDVRRRAAEELHRPRHADDLQPGAAGRRRLDRAARDELEAGDAVAADPAAAVLARGVVQPLDAPAVSGHPGPGRGRRHAGPGQRRRRPRGKSLRPGAARDRAVRSGKREPVPALLRLDRASSRSTRRC